MSSIVSDRYDPQSPAFQSSPVPASINRKELLKQASLNAGTTMIIIAILMTFAFSTTIMYLGLGNFFNTTYQPTVFPTPGPSYHLTDQPSQLPTPGPTYHWTYHPTSEMPTYPNITSEIEKLEYSEGTVDSEEIREEESVAVVSSTSTSNTMKSSSDSSSTSIEETDVDSIESNEVNLTTEDSSNTSTNKNKSKKSKKSSNSKNKQSKSDTIKGRRR